MTGLFIVIGVKRTRMAFLSTKPTAQAQNVALEGKNLLLSNLMVRLLGKAW